LPSESIIERFVSMGIFTKEDIRIQPFSVFDVIDLISTTKKKEILDVLKLKIIVCILILLLMIVSKMELNF
jgi:hypothetical protein